MGKFIAIKTSLFLLILNTEVKGQPVDDKEIAIINDFFLQDSLFENFEYISDFEENQPLKGIKVLSKACENYLNVIRQYDKKLDQVDKMFLNDSQKTIYKEKINSLLKQTMEELAYCKNNEKYIPLKELIKFLENARKNEIKEMSDLIKKIQ